MTVYGKYNTIIKTISLHDIREYRRAIMPRKQLQTLSEPMYYILLVLKEEQNGVDIMKRVLEVSKGRVKVGAGTLYTLLGKFEKEGLINSTKREGRKCWYIITNKGREILQTEYNRLNTMIDDGEILK